MSTKGLLRFIGVLVVISVVFAPYGKFLVQRQALDTDLSRITLDYTTLGRVEFEKRIDHICEENRLKPGSYQVSIKEEKKVEKISVEIRYEGEFTIFFVPRTKTVVLQHEFDALKL